jgi:cytoplasmic iron level regulating protein YaaA (DUF328/UPF0246 family)
VLVLLVPPSEGKVRGGDGPGWDVASGRFAELAARRRRVANALKRARGGNQKLLGARGDLLAAAREANRALVGAPTLPAWQRFSGVVWEHLDPQSLGGRARRRAEAGVVVVSAVTGLSAWDDPVPDFRLKLSASLPPMGGLAAFWRTEVSRALDDFASGHTVVDLLPNEHRAAWVPDETRYELVRPGFTVAGGRPAGHAGKAAKGRVARMLLERGRVDPGTTVEFDGVVVTFG